MPILRSFRSDDLSELEILESLERLTLADQDPALWAEFRDNMIRHFHERLRFALDTGAFFLLVEDDIVVAYGGFGVGPSGEPELVKIRTHPDHRRKGYARTVVAALETAAIERGFSVMTLDTNEKNVAGRAFYESMGYVLDRVEPTFPGRAAAYYRKGLLPYVPRSAA